MARAQIEDGAVIRIDGQPFPVAAAVFIAAKLEGHVGVLKGLAAVAGTQYGAIRRGGIGIGAAGKIHAIGIGRVDGDAFDAHPVEVFVRHPVEQRFPAMGEIVPAVSAADIGAGVAHALGGRVEDDAVHEPAAHHLHALPGVGDGCGALVRHALCRGCAAESGQHRRNPQ